MFDILMHALIPLLAFVCALFVERYRIWVLSRLLFWKRRGDLMGTYATSWVVEQPPPAFGANGKVEPQLQVEELARIRWASGSYISGTASSAHYGDYAFQGRTDGDAITLSYCSNEKRLKAYLGVVMLRIEGDGAFSGHWMQNRPDKFVMQVGTAVWKKREK
ncbi:MAG: hypothetical protein ABI227_06220 [Rhodanobacter sp.]